MANSSTDSIGSCHADLEHTTRDIFHGTALIDRLLVYFSKFEGNREKARRYAQKLLDLGHIESLTHSSSFEDSPQEYRWTDVASVVNKAKAKAQEQEDANADAVAHNTTFESPNSKVNVRQKHGMPKLRISIEADNCDGAEIQAHIRTNPQVAKTKNAAVRTATKNGDTVQYTEIQNGKMISFMTETSKTEEILRMVPVSAMSQRNEANDSFAKTIPVDVKIITHSPERKCETTEDASFDATKEKKNSPNSSTNGDSALGEDESSTVEVTSPIVTSVAPGKGDAPPINHYDRGNENGEPSDRYPSEIHSKSNSLLENGFVRPERPNLKPTIHKYKWDASRENLRDDSNAKLTESVHRPHDSLTSSAESSPTKEKPGSASSTSSGSVSSRNTPTPPIPQNHVSRKLKFKEDNEWIKMRKEYLEHEEIREIAERSLVNEVELFDNPGLSLHSMGPHETIEEEPEDLEREAAESSQTKKPNSSFLAPPPQPLITISPPPSSPTSPRKQADQGIKSLFWTKISCFGTKIQADEAIFWLNMEKNVKFDQTEFSRLFSKPLPSPLQKSSRKVIQEDTTGTKTLKVLGSERSRQVGIRASSIRLQAEDIHDAIINMDDLALNLDALEALYDVRPTPDELDDIADALKRNSNGILDKPEQFVLMLAMLGNLDERLKSWILVKKFPDKVLDIKEQLNAVSRTCIEIVRNAPLQRLLEATLAFGNFMNKGTQRGEADGFFFDILPKLKDVKSQANDTNLMVFLVQWIIEEKEKGIGGSNTIKRQESMTSSLSQSEQSDDCGLPNQMTMQKACATTLQDSMEEIDILSAELSECKEQLIPAVVEGATCLPEIKPFNERMKDFVEQADKALTELRSLFTDVTRIAEEFKKYYVPGGATSESFSSMLKHLCAFCDDFRSYWDEEKRNVAKEAFFNTERARRQRMAAVKIAKSPSALKARFLEMRRRERGHSYGTPETSVVGTNLVSKIKPCRCKYELS